MDRLFQFASKLMEDYGKETLMNQEEIKRLRERLRMAAIERNLEPLRRFVEQQKKEVNHE